ncbi:hypothetical protein GCM10010172_01210 [Paractinoplanes ferrugineus]|uniref:Uncharacterized protein n=1 Tax=Paractinoplanes ferrugineus TaxID=113564 RepID=A0A919MFN3_9ACTN|nr:hypothetical protein Afe05nite_58080 [Actinoplanes ferrugineus]
MNVGPRSPLETPFTEFVLIFARLVPPGNCEPPSDRDGPAGAIPSFGASITHQTVSH